MRYETFFNQLRPLLIANKELVENRAKKLWVASGRPENKDEHFWLAAEKQILDELADTIIRKVISPQIQETAANIDFAVGSKVQVLREKAKNVLAKYHAEQDAVLPEGVRFYRNQFGKHLVVFEDFPKVRTLNICKNYHEPYIGRHSNYSRFANPEYVNYRLALPYVVYIMRIDEKGSFNFNVFFRNAPLKSLTDKLLIAQIPNVRSDGTPCNPWATITQTTTYQQATIYDKIKMVLAFFWDTKFNYYLTDHPADSRLTTFERWQDFSKENPLFATSVNWFQTDISFKYFMQGYDFSYEFREEAKLIADEMRNLLSLKLPPKS